MTKSQRYGNTKMKTNLLPIFALLIVGCGNRNPANIVVENRIRQTEQTDSIIGDSYERDTIQGDFNLSLIHI